MNAMPAEVHTAAKCWGMNINQNSFIKQSFVIQR